MHGKCFGKKEIFCRQLYFMFVAALSYSSLKSEYFQWEKYTKILTLNFEAIKTNLI